MCTTRNVHFHKFGYIIHSLSMSSSSSANKLGLIDFCTIYKAAIADDWESAKPVFGEEKNVYYDFPDFDFIEGYSFYPLHLAVATNSSHRFVKELVDWIMRVGGRQMLNSASGVDRSTALHWAALAGNTKDARLLIDKDPEMAQTIDNKGQSALTVAAYGQRKETLCYLLEVTKDVINEEGTSPYRGEYGAALLCATIITGFYDVALYLVKNYPHLVTEKARGCYALETLAAQPIAFKSGSKLGFWQRIVYSWIPVNEKKALESPISKPSEVTTSQNRTCGARIHESKVRHLQSKELVEQMCLTVMNKGDKTLAWDVFGKAISTAVKHGIYELIEQCCHHYPAVINYKVKGLNLFVAAISERQEKVYNLVYQMSGFKVFKGADGVPKEKGSPLHIAGKLAPRHRLDTVTGAALQMQRELQWFKEVEKFVVPVYKESIDGDDKTPRMVFTSEHTELLKEAKQWMKDASSSGTVVAALIVTIAFAAIFTAPGGNNDKGKPLFLSDAVFILFAISDAIALFSSSTSVIMLLAVLNSRFAQEDFLYSLPNRLALGLISLFISIAATMVAFSASLSLVLRDKIQWISAPVILLASVPVTLFLLLQYPLLVELVRSTYGRGIFYQQSRSLLH